MTETLVAVAAGTLIIGAGALAMRSTQTLIQGSGEKASQRQNTMNGRRLVRTEIERSQYVLVHGEPPTELEYTNLVEEADIVEYCQALAANKNQGESLSAQDKAQFLPLFGLKMIDVAKPVIYGLSTGTGRQAFAIKRCGTPLALDGSYDETQEPFVASVIDGIGYLPCDQADNSCPEPQLEGGTTSDGELLTSSEILQYINQQSNEKPFEVDENHASPLRSYMEPALRFETDGNRKLVKIIGPMECDPSNTQDNKVCIENSFVEVHSASRSLSRQPLHLTAYARADKRLANDNGSAGVLGGDWFRNITSSRLRFLVDGSGSMSACMSWSFDANGNIAQGNSQRIFYTPTGDPMRRGRNSYVSTRAICSETRMERLQKELTLILENLPADTKIALDSFSTPGYQNNVKWSASSNGLVTIGDGDNRQSAIAFVDQLNNGDPRYWGGTYPWNGLDDAFDDQEADIVYFLSDGQPTQSPPRKYRWKRQDFMPAAPHYAAMNDTRDIKMQANTTAVEIASPWMSKLSELTSGDHLQSQ